MLDGALRERIAAPLDQGEVMMRITELDDLHAELKVPEREVEEVSEGGSPRGSISSAVSGSAVEQC